MLPILFQIGSFKVHTYGVVLVVAFVVALAIARARAPKFGIDPKKVTDISFWALIGGVLGARLLFILQEHPKDWYSLQFAGLTSFGGIIGGLAVFLIWGWLAKIPLRAFLDVVAPAFLVAHAIGRVGCLLNGCCFGNACPGLPWGIPAGENHVISHPAQAYDTLMNLAAFGILLGWEKVGHFKFGQTFSAMLILHGLTRFIYEFWRAGTVEQVEKGLASSTYWDRLPITQAQAAAGVLILLGIILFFVYSRKPAMHREAIPA
jgi:phosphatidylglycerol:prolipoprotein diacylglycerol transferase